MENSERSSNASEALTFSYGAADEESVIDMLTDLRHFCKQEGIDFDQVLSTSEIHFNEEE